MTTTVGSNDLLAALQTLPAFFQAVRDAAQAHFQNVSLDVVAAEDLAHIIGPLLPLLPIPYEAQAEMAIRLAEQLLPMVPMVVRVASLHVEPGTPPWYHPGPGR